MPNEFKIKNGLILESITSASQNSVLTYNASTGLVHYTASSALGGGSGVTINNNTDNYIITGTGTANTLNGEQNLTFNGSTLSVTGSLVVTGSGIILTGSIFFESSSANVGIARQVGWDDGDSTLNIGLSGSIGSIPTLKIGQQQVARIYNAESVPITKGQVVYLSGSQGNRVAVKLASASTEATSAETIGFVLDPSIAAGGEGYITTEGPLYKLNTLGLTQGSILYLSTTSGQYTQTAPTAPNHRVVLGFVERVDNTVGSIYVKIDNGYELDELHNIKITNPVYGDLLMNSGSVWINTKQLSGSYVITGSLGHGFAPVMGISAHAEGRITRAMGRFSHAEGEGSEANGEYSHAEGNFTITYADYSHAEGYACETYGDESHAEGNSTYAYGNQSHAEGSNTYAYGDESHAEGCDTKTRGVGSHAEGIKTLATGAYSHAEGSASIAFGVASHAGGLHTIASGSYQTTVGQYNTIDNITDLFVIGGGAAHNDRKDVFNVSTTRIAMSGSVYISGSLFATASWAVTASHALTASAVTQQVINSIQIFSLFAG